MSDSRPSSRGGRRGANGTSARSNTSSSANTSSLAKNKTFTSLKPEEKKQVEHVKELKPEWSDDQLIEFCGKYNYDANTIQQGLENIFEDAARENVDEWTQVKKKASAKPKSETPSAPSQSSSAAPGPRGASAGRGRGAASTGAPSTRGASATRGGAAPRGGPRPSTNAQSKPDAESGAWAHAAAGAGWGDNSNTAQATVTGTATVSQGVPATGVPPVVVPPNPFTGKDSFLDRLMARDRAKENEKLAAQQAAQKEKEDKERSIREAEERKIREAQEAEDRKIREAQEAQRRLEDDERQRQEAEARAQAEAQAAAEAAAAAQAAQEEEARRQAEEAARQQQAALEAEQAAQAMAALQLKQQQEAAAQAAQSAQADDQVLSPIGARGSGFGNKAPGSAWRKAKEETVVQPAYTAAEFQAAEQSSVSALYSPEDPVILPQHLKDQTSAFDAPISFGTFNLPRKTDTATSTTPSFNQSLVSPQEPANRFAQDAQTATTPQAAPSTQTAAQTQAGDQSDALHQQPSTFMQFPGGMPPNALGQRSGYEDPQMYNQFYPYMMPPQNFGGMPGYDESQGFFDPAYSGYGRDGRKQAGGIVPGGGRGNRNFRQGGFPGAGLGPNPVIGLQGKDDKSKLGQQGPVQGVQPSKFSSSPPSGAQPQSVSPPPQNDQSPNSAQNGPQAGTPPNFGPVSAAPSAIPNAGSSFDKSRNPKLPRAGGAYQPKTNNFNKGPAGPAAQTFNGGGKQQGTYQNKKQFGGAAGPSTFNKKSQSFTPSQPQAAGQFQNPNPYYPYNPYYAAPYYGQYPPGFGRGGFYNPQQYGYPPYGGHQSPTFEENYDKNMAPYAGYDASQGQDYSQWGPNSQLPMGQDDGSFAAQGVQAPPSPSAEQNKQQGLGGGMDDRLGAAANPQIGGGRQMGRFQPQQGQQPQAAQQQQYGAMPLNLGQQQYNYSVPHQAYPAQGYGYQQPASDPNQQQQYWQS